jgi:photosystem II stability/assembly factor-like uncharacterized protein
MIKQRFFFLFLMSFLFMQCKEAPKSVSGAGKALDAWYLERSHPTGKLPNDQFYKAFEARKKVAQERTNLPNWTAIGPENIAGRTLVLAFHPTDKDIIYLGSAGGGLWRTTTGGKGAKAWERIATGFPLLGVAAIAINPENPDEIYIGTGEMYNSFAAAPGIISIVTRGTYGIGILKTEDGGITWHKSLDWRYENFTGVQELTFHPHNKDIIYAGTSKGLMRSADKGSTWEIIHDLPMAVDIAINPENPDIIYVSHGSFYHQEFAGIYRSMNGGVTFERLGRGYIDGYTGKTMIALDPNDPSTIIASVANAFESRGLYRSKDHGNNWNLLNNEDVALWQGWYSHDVAINPYNSNELVYVGIDSWWSPDQGLQISVKGTYEGRPRGKVLAGEPDGPPGYVHSDIHRAYYHPLVEDLVFLATDGGVFVSQDGGIGFESRNGGLQTTQFYANFSNSTTDSAFAIGGMQDNNSAIYDGTSDWVRVLGGDGMSAAIHPNNDHFVYGSSQYAWISRSLNKGRKFDLVKEGNSSGAFSSPLEIAPSSPHILYTASSIIERSVDAGATWTRQDQRLIDRGNPILKLKVSPFNPDFIIFGTVPTKVEHSRVFISKNGGRDFEVQKDLPNLIARDFVFHPDNDEIIYAIFSGFAVFSGFANSHIYKTEDAGKTWELLANNLPDLPHHSLLIDPENTDHLYIGNDLGVYFSEDGGSQWRPMIAGLPEAVYAMHLSYSPSNRKIRLATHGNGVYEAPMVHQVTEGGTGTNTDFSLKISPNPSQHFAKAVFFLSEEMEVNLNLYDAKGALVQKIVEKANRKGKQIISTNLDQLAAGVYFFELTLKGKNDDKINRYSEQFIKL